LASRAAAASHMPKNVLNLAAARIMADYAVAQNSPDPTPMQYAALSCANCRFGGIKFRTVLQRRGCFLSFKSRPIGALRNGSNKSEILGLNAHAVL
jgi:hypothetical protein